MRIVVATGNRGKLVEYERLLGGVAGVECVSLGSLGLAASVEEDGLTFRDNALKKARAAAVVLASEKMRGGWCALADDSGLCVDALDGAPGVWSARYAGEQATDEDNYRKLLAALDRVAEGQRGARFVCTIALVDAHGDEVFCADGVCEGQIARAPRGSHGFGYDPVFIPSGYQQTMAELSPDTKNAISHRAVAAAKVAAFLSEGALR